MDKDFSGGKLVIGGFCKWKVKLCGKRAQGLIVTFLLYDLL